MSKLGSFGGAILALLLLAGFALKGQLIEPPAAPAHVSESEFDPARALGRLSRILGDERPHPVDSAANDAVRERLLAELRAIGLSPRVQEAVDCSAMPRSRAVSCSRVRNVIATVGSGPGKHVLLNAHYDSTPTGPGAADDGIGVASMLEIAAVLQQRPPARPVSFLFNEGEEFGLNGASAFVRDDPLAKQVDSLVNIEARGVSGPAMMFETSDPNGAAIRLFADAARRPFANSLSMDFARLIPNTTDVVEFRPAGWTMLNYAIIGNETRYHTPGDTIASLDRDSLYHVGNEALAATRAFAERSNPPSNGHMVFTDIAGRLFIALPVAFAAAWLALLLVGAAVLAWRRQAIGKPLLLAAAMMTGGIAVPALVAIASSFLRSGDFWRAWPLVTYLALYALVILVMAAVWARWGGRFDRTAMRAAAWLLILLVGAALSLALPGASIFFLFAPTLALAGLVLESRSNRLASVLLVAAILLQFLMFAQLLALIEMLLVDGPLWAVAPLAALAILPVILELQPCRMRPSLMTTGAAFVALWGAAMVLPRSSADRPLAFSIDYFRDDATGEAHWGIASKQAPLPAGYSGEWRKGTLAYNMRTRWIGDAPNIDVPTPRAQILSSEPLGNGRRVRLRLSPSGGQAVSIRFAKDAPVRALGLPGAPIPIPARGDPEKASLRCSGRSCEEFIVEAVLGNREPVVAELFATRFALPPEGAPLAAARPADAHPQYSPDSSIRRRMVRF